MAVTQPETKVVRWKVPGLVERPAVGTSCCASTAEAIVAQELAMLLGIEDVAIDGAGGVVAIAFQPAQVSEAAIAAALAEIGYPPQWP